MTDRLIPLGKVAARFSVRAAYLVELSARGEFPTTYNLGTSQQPRWRVDPEAVERWLATRTADHWSRLRDVRLALARPVAAGASAGRLPQHRRLRGGSTARSSGA